MINFIDARLTHIADKTRHRNKHTVRARMCPKHPRILTRYKAKIIGHTVFVCHKCALHDLNLVNLQYVGPMAKKGK